MLFGFGGKLHLYNNKDILGYMFSKSMQLKGGNRMKKNFIFAIFLMLVLGSLNFVVALGALNAPVLTVNNPVDMVYNSKTILFDLGADQESDFYLTKYIHRPAGWKVLCRDTMDCQKEVRFTEGDNRVLIKAVNSAGERKSEVLSFSIDTRAPKVHRVEPRRSSFTNGEHFSVQYTEAQTESVTLFYGTDSITRTDCGSGRREVCDFDSVDLSDYDGQEIDYWFQIIDVAGNIGLSKVTKINVDTSAPVTHFYEKEIVRRRVNFVFEIEEQNFDVVEYIDNTDKHPRWKKLCSKFRNGRCDTRKSFRTGTHDVDIRVVDKAGNSEMVVVGDAIVI